MPSCTYSQLHLFSLFIEAEVLKNTALRNIFEPKKGGGNRTVEKTI